jgi:hypothetical protein
MKVPAPLTLSLVLIACAEQPQRAESGPSDAPSAAEAREYCGGELLPGAAKDYAGRLSEFLASGDARAPDALYADNFYLSDTDGRKIQRGVGPDRNREAELTRQEWGEIAERLPSDLKSVGWRGCILGDGKASFESGPDEHAKLVLRNFDRTRPWRE